MPLVRIASKSALLPGYVQEFKTATHRYAVCNHDGKICVLDGECPCTGGPLGDGALRDGVLVCPWHGWRFDPITGVSEYDDTISIATYPTQIQGDDVLADLP